MEKPPSRRAWLIPGLIAVILFIGGVASNLIASDIQERQIAHRIS